MFDPSKLTPEFFTALGSGLLNGGTNTLQALGNGMAAGTQALSAQDKQAKQLKFIEQYAPSFAEAVKAGVMSPADAYSAAITKPKSEFKQLDDGTYGSWDGSNFTPLGRAQKPMALTSLQRDLQAAGIEPGSPEYQKYILQNYNKAGGEDVYANREAAADRLGMTKDDPRRQTFILTGNMPKQNEAPLTATDKKAILDADEMVQVNQQAIDALKSARNIQDKANSGFGAGTRATIGANLPDWMVPDAVSSPESSNATLDYDNAVVGQALTQLKAIFGGAPTEGERKILLDLQGSSNMPPEVRKAVLDRAISAAEARLEFNRKRAEELRGGEYYQPKTQNSPAPNGVNSTSGGVKWKVVE